MSASNINTQCNWKTIVHSLYSVNELQKTTGLTDLPSLIADRCHSLFGHIQGHTCFTSITSSTPPATDWKRPPENLASTGGRRYGSTHQCLSIRNPGPLAVEIATTLSLSRAAVGHFNFWLSLSLSETLSWTLKSPSEWVSEWVSVSFRTTRRRWGTQTGVAKTTTHTYIRRFWRKKLKQNTETAWNSFRSIVSALLVYLFVCFKKC